MPGPTYHHSVFTARGLAARKAAAGVTISVVVPARDEEETVGRVASVLRSRLQDEVPLVDQILVVDGDSVDATAHEARRVGVEVVRQSEVLPEAGAGMGKGEALWKGLAASHGDLVVFVDADIVDFDERFVVGLLGPLLVDQGVLFTKAAYDRPLRIGEELRPSGGGRVTELLARPLIATFWPELSWLAQPLSGEYAGRRELLESLPFVQGYGVELAMLVDIAAAHGADRIAEVDLDRRVHEHQSLDALGRMAGEILHVALERVAGAGRMVLTDDLGEHLLQPFRDAQGDIGRRPARIAPSERPPLAVWRETDRRR